VSVAAILVLAFPGHVSVAAILRLGHLASMCLLPLLQFLLAFPFSKLLFLIILFFPTPSFGEGRATAFSFLYYPLYSQAEYHWYYSVGVDTNFLKILTNKP
jgi:hypothetical protein